MSTFESKKLRKNLLKLKKQSKNLVQSSHQPAAKHGLVTPDSATSADVLAPQRSITLMQKTPMSETF